MKRFMPVFLFLLVFAALPTSAQVRWGARAGIVDGEAMIGGDVVIVLGAGQVIFNPNVELSSKLVSTNADFHYDFGINRDSAFWLGAGLALVTPEEQDLDAGVNLLLGLGVRQAPRIYYTQLKYTKLSAAGSYASAAFGMRF
jgi:hypothetical protein